MGLIRLIGAGVLVWALGAGAAHAQWTPESCNEAVSITLDQLEEASQRIEMLKADFVEAQRKGDAARIDATLGSLRNAREVGIGQQLRYIDTQPYRYCDRSRIDPALVARVDTYRPLAEETDALTVEEERAPLLEIVGIASTLVPSVPRESGGCTGPYVDLIVKVVNRGGVFPRPVDMEARLARFPAGETEPYLTLDLFFDFPGDVTDGYQQATIGKAQLPNGILTAGAALDVPIRMAVISGQKQAAVTAHATAGFLLTTDGVESRTPVFATGLTIPVWDIYTVSTQTVSTLQTEGEDKGKYRVGLQARIINNGDTATPGPVLGNFTVRHEEDGPDLAHISGATSEAIGPGGTGLITDFQMVRNDVTSPIVVHSQIYLLCPDGGYGVIVDGNDMDNDRILKER